MKKLKKINTIYTYFIILSLVFGISYSIIIPLFQVPDEAYHINSIYSVFNNEDGYNVEKSKASENVKNITNNTEIKINRKNYFNFDEKLGKSWKIKNINYDIIKYLPQSIGILVSEIFHFPLIIAFSFCELLSVIFYTIVCLIALKKIPIKKEIFMLCMLLPMCIQQASSFSYDVVLLSFSFLYIANIIYFKFKGDIIKPLDLLKLIVYLIIISIVKLPYIFFIFLVLVIPLQKFFFYKKIEPFLNKKKLKYLVISLIIFLILIIIFTFKNKLLSSAYFKVLLSFLTDPIDGLNLIVKTVLSNFKFYILSLIGYFGWFDVKVSYLFCAFVIFSAFIINFLCDEQNIAFKKRDKWYINIFLIIFFIIIIISLYDWTLRYLGIDTIGFGIHDYSNSFKLINAILGVQGRYFLPFLPLFFIAFHINLNIKNKRKKLLIYQIMYYITTYVYTFIIIFKRYWI